MSAATAVHYKWFSYALAKFNDDQQGHCECWNPDMLMPQNREAGTRDWISKSLRETDNYTCVNKRPADLPRRQAGGKIIGREGKMR